MLFMPPLHAARCPFFPLILINFRTYAHATNSPAAVAYKLHTSETHNKLIYSSLVEEYSICGVLQRSTYTRFSIELFCSPKENFKLSNRRANGSFMRLLIVCRACIVDVSTSWLNCVSRDSWKSIWIGMKCVSATMDVMNMRISFSICVVLTPLANSLDALTATISSFSEEGSFLPFAVSHLTFLRVHRDRSETHLAVIHTVNVYLLEGAVKDPNKKRVGIKSEYVERTKLNRNKNDFGPAQTFITQTWFVF